MQCLFKFVLVAEEHLNVLCVIDNDLLHQVDQHMTVQFGDVLILAEQAYPRDILLVVPDRLRPLLLQKAEALLAFRYLAVIPGSELRIFLFADDAVRHVAVQVQFQVLVLPDLSVQPLNLCVIVEYLPPALREGRNIRQRPAHLTDLPDMVMEQGEHDLLQFLLAEAVSGAALPRFVG